LAVSHGCLLQLDQMGQEGLICLHQTMGPVAMPIHHFLSCLNTGKYRSRRSLGRPNVICIGPGPTVSEYNDISTEKCNTSHHLSIPLYTIPAIRFPSQSLLKLARKFASKLHTPLFHLSTAAGSLVFTSICRTTLFADSHCTLL